MSELVLKCNRITGDVERIAEWPDDGSAGIDAHCRNARNSEQQICYRTCMEYEFESYAERFRDQVTLQALLHDAEIAHEPDRRFEEQDRLDQERAPLGGGVL